jgi:hypothetical protein
MRGGMEVTDKKKLGGMGKLSQFSGIKKGRSAPAKPESPPNEPEIKEPSVQEPELEIEAVTQEPLVEVLETTVKEPEKISKTEVEPKIQARAAEEKLVKINIDITKTQKEWLADTASQVRENNLEPVPPLKRVYPQHLIRVAIDLLEASDVDWGQIKNVEELREQLNL